MSQSFPETKGKHRLPEAQTLCQRVAEGDRSMKFDSLYKPNRRVLAIDRDKMHSRKLLDEGLRSALLSQDKDVALILREVSEITKSLKSSPLDRVALSEALHRSVLCAVKRFLLDKEFRSLALMDDLTNLYNRRAFFALAAQQIKVMRRKTQGLLLFFADVDHLKNINDTYGHREGDLALVRTADALKRTFRNSDIVARLGGDEFAVLALEASCQDQDTILRRLESHLQKASAVEPRYKLSLSAGAARFDPKHSVSLGDLLAKADQAMYEQKSTHPEMWMSRP